MAGLFKKVGRLFRRRTTKPSVKFRRSRETLGGGHRGIAAGAVGKPDFTAENVSKWRTLPADAVEGFVYESEPLFVHSTNVEMAQYFFDAGQMLVSFLEDGTYLYDNVTEDEAVGFAKASSKGSWVWDVLRVRGSRTAHRKPYRKVSPGYRPPQKGTEERIEIDEETYIMTREADGRTRFRLEE